MTNSFSKVEHGKGEFWAKLCGARLEKGEQAIFERIAYCCFYQFEQLSKQARSIPIFLNSLGWRLPSHTYTMHFTFLE